MDCNVPRERRERTLIRRFLKDLTIWVGIPFVSFMISWNIKAPQWIINVSFISIMIGILMFMLIVSFPITIKEPKYKNNTTLYQWLDDLSDFDQKLTSSLKRYYVHYGTLDNLISLKDILKKQSGSDKSVLKMYRAFYNQKLKESGEELYLRTIMISLIPLGILLAKGKVELFVKQPLQVLLLAIFIMIFLAFISIRLSINKRRNGILIEVIDLCIEEIEDVENQKKEKKTNEIERKRNRKRVRGSRRNY